MTKSLKPLSRNIKGVTLKTNGQSPFKSPSSALNIFQGKNGENEGSPLITNGQSPFKSPSSALNIFQGKNGENEGSPLITKVLCPFESFSRFVGQGGSLAEVISNPKGLPYKTGENEESPFIIWFN